MSPASAAIEQVAAGWLLDLLALPASASVGFVTGATMANTTALAAARHEVLRRIGWDVEADGLQGAPRVTVIAGRGAHASISNAARFIGLGTSTIVYVEADDQGRMVPLALEEALSGASGPAIVCEESRHVAPLSPSRQLNLEPRTHPEPRALRADRSAVQFDEMPRESQAQPQPALVSPIRFPLPESLKDVREVVVDAGAGTDPANDEILLGKAIPRDDEGKARAALAESPREGRGRRGGEVGTPSFPYRAMVTSKGRWSEIRVSSTSACVQRRPTVRNR